MTNFKELIVTITGALLLSFIFRTAAFATYYIPSESMVPTLEVGDRLAVSKWRYGWNRNSVPGLETQNGGQARILGQMPKRGDVAVFRHPHDDMTMIKRVIGLPGDKIVLHGGRLYINDALVERRFKRDYAYREHEGGVIRVREFVETLPGATKDEPAVSHTIIERSDFEFSDLTQEYNVPEGHLFMMGDNRDNSSDSRYPQMGFVPIGNLIGRADRILFSLKDCRPEPGVTCPRRRIFSPIL